MATEGIAPKLLSLTPGGAKSGSRVGTGRVAEPLENKKSLERGHRFDLSEGGQSSDYGSWLGLCLALGLGLWLGFVLGLWVEQRFSAAQMAMI